MPTPRRLTTALAQRLTPVVALAIVVFGVAAILAAAQLFLLTLPLMGLAALLTGSGFILLTWKLQSIGVTTKALQRRMDVLATSAQPPPPLPPSSSSSPPTPEAPEPPAVASPSPAPEPPRGDATAHHLVRLIHGGGSAEAPLRRRIALVGSTALRDRLTAHGSVIPLHPRMSVAELEQATPDTLVVEEDAIDSGPWIGALDPQGAELLAELRTAVEWMRRNDGAVVVLPASGARKAGAQSLRTDTVVLDEATMAAQRVDAPPSLLSALAAHRHGQPTA
ncbi:hypothetical protein [Tessaracoccus antarcticus]|uniref:hypothetical protein n=1 Tax=Tessaracoccus antarcticus TaxID=2479848 RepID=UPI0018F3A19B|nr:hypothetical protein [Tessaracoccus antarcticus]